VIDRKIEHNVMKYLIEVGNVTQFPDTIYTYIINIQDTISPCHWSHFTAELQTYGRLPSKSRCLPFFSILADKPSRLPTLRPRMHCLTMSF